MVDLSLGGFESDTVSEYSKLGKSCKPSMGSHRVICSMGSQVSYSIGSQVCDSKSSQSIDQVNLVSSILESKYGLKKVLEIYDTFSSVSGDARDSVEHRYRTNRYHASLRAWPPLWTRGTTPDWGSGIGTRSGRLTGTA